eukprot:3934644-Rhodomonas_salina.2
MFEIYNKLQQSKNLQQDKLEKKIVLHHSNRKNFEKQWPRDSSSDTPSETEQRSYQSRDHLEVAKQSRDHTRAEIILR